MYLTQGSAWYPDFSMIFRYRTYVLKRHFHDHRNSSCTYLNFINVFFSFMNKIYLYPRSCEIRYFKFNLNGRFSFCIFCSHTWQTKMSSHQILFSSREGFNGPNDCRLLWSVFTVTCLKNKIVN